MIYLLQDIKESDVMRIEIEELKVVLEEYYERYPVADRYKIVTSDYFNNYNDEFTHDWMKTNAVPVGSLEFVHAYLKKFHSIPKLNPIEIPRCLRLPHLLLREYKIVPYSQIPDEGNYFVKDVTKLKNWSCLGNVSNLKQHLIDRKHFEEDGFVQVSQTIDILAEYRVCVMQNKIVGIQFYDGDPTIMPNETEIKKIKEMVIRWSMDKNCPQASTMDVAVIKTNDKRGRDLALIECHPFVSVGTYGCRGSFLPTMFRLGIQWYIEHNEEIEIG